MAAPAATLLHASRHLYDYTATLYRKALFDSYAKSDLLRDITFELTKSYCLILQAWAFFPNHYHFVVSFENATTTHRDFVRHLHREGAIQLNRIDGAAGPRVMYEFWDTHLTFEKSWLARLNYVHQNAVKHRLVPLANEYLWCSAAWFETNARTGFVKSVYSFKTDRISVPMISERKAMRRRIALPKHHVRNPNAKFSSKKSRWRNFLLDFRTKCGDDRSAFLAPLETVARLPRPRYSQVAK